MPPPPRVPSCATADGAGLPQRWTWVGSIHGLGLVGLDRLNRLAASKVEAMGTSCRAIVTVTVRLDCFVTVCRRHNITDIRSGSILYF